MSRLYELADSYKQVQRMADDTEDMEVIRNTLESIQTSIEEKAANTIKVIANMDNDINAIKEEEKRLSERRKALENRRDGIKKYIQYNMENAGLDRIKTPLITLSIKTNPPKVVIEDESLIPAGFKTVKQEVVVDKKELAKKLKKGKVPGARLEQGTRLEIK